MKACHLPKSLLNISCQEHTPISLKCLVCCILQGINLYHQWQNVLGIHIIWQPLHLAVPSPCTSPCCNLFCDEGIGHLFLKVSRGAACGLQSHGSSHCHRCSGVQLPQSVFDRLLHLILLHASGSLAHERSLLVHMTSGLNRLTAGKFVNVCLGRCTAQKHLSITTAGNVQLDTWQALCPLMRSPPLVGHTQHSAFPPLSHPPQPLPRVSHPAPHTLCCRGHATARSNTR